MLNPTHYTPTLVFRISNLLVSAGPIPTAQPIIQLRNDYYYFIFKCLINNFYIFMNYYSIHKGKKIH